LNKLRIAFKKATNRISDALHKKRKIKRDNNILILGGYKNGIIVFGETLTDTFAMIKELFNSIS